MAQVIDAKLHCPDPTGLVRSRLVDPLIAEDGPGVVLVIAPPGAGKTTLLARAAESVTRVPAWCSVGPEDRSSAGFLAHVVRSTSVAARVDVGNPSSAVELLEALSRAGARPVTLVLDDVHELEGSPAEAALSDLVRWGPPQVRLLVGTRRPLAANTPRLIVSGNLLELDAEALRFRSWEVEELFRLVYNEPLSPEGAAALTRRTGGWAAGLTLFHLATAGKPAVDRERAVTELGGRSRLLRSYLTRTVLDDLAPDRRTFLLTTSTLGTLTGPLCDALLEREGSAPVLEELAERQFFLVASEDGSTFRYHQVMQTLLEGLLVDELGTRAAAATYARSAALLESAGLWSEALRAYALAEDQASIARLVQQNDARLAGEHAAALAAGTDDPWLALARARRLQRLGSLRASLTAFRHAESLLDDADFRHRCHEERFGVALWLPDVVPTTSLGSAGGAGPRRGEPSVAELVRRLTRRVDHAALDSPQPLAAGLARLMAGDFDGAREAFCRVAADPAAHRLSADLALVVTDLASRTAGTGVTLLGRLEQIVLAADLEDLPWLARVARGLQAAVLLVTGEQAWRVESGSALVEECRRGGDDWGASLLCGAIGVALAVRRDPTAPDWLTQAAEGSGRLAAPTLQAWASAAALLTRSWNPSPDPEAPDRAARVRLLARSCGLADLEGQVRATLGDLSTRGSTETLDSVTFSSAPVQRLRVRCLGGFGIERDGVPVELPPLRPLPRSLLLLLASCHGRDVHREVLVDALWPDTGVEAAGHRLHAAASSVRRCLADAGIEEGAVHRHGSGYRLQLPGAELDVAQFEHLLRRVSRSVAGEDPEDAFAACVQALDLYRGDLLVEAGPAEWVVTERDRLRTAAASTAATAGRLALRLRRPEDALTPARRATVLDPFCDSSWALLAEVQTQLGDVIAAAATRHRYARLSASADELFAGP